MAVGKDKQDLNANVCYPRLSTKLSHKLKVEISTANCRFLKQRLTLQCSWMADVISHTSIMPSSYLEHS